MSSKRKSRQKRKNQDSKYISLPEFSLSSSAKNSIYLLILLALALISFLSLLNLAGHFGIFIAHYLELIFGYGEWLIPLIFLYGSLLFIQAIKKSLNFSDYLGFFLLFISYQTLFHFFIDPANWERALLSGKGGGYIGLYLSKFFLYSFGFWGGLAILVLLLLISLILVFDTSLKRLIGRESFIARFFQVFGLFFKKLFSRSPEEENEEDEENEGQKYINEARDEILSAWQEKEVPANLEKVADENFNQEEISPSFSKQKKGKGVQEKIKWPQRNIKIDIPIELLNNEFSKAHGGDIEFNVKKIKQTLEKFGIPVEMGKSNVGPTVTQYTFRPADGVKLSRITTLNNDLSLALAAHPIRIEAPIPGKSLVGIEVPNHTKAIVGLREVLESKAFKKRKNNLYIALGKDVAGQSYLSDLTRMPHLLVAGATNSGKSVCLNSIIVSLLYQNNPADLRFIMVDPKRVELPIYNGIPHLLTPVITDANKTINALKWCLNEMERRYDLLSEAGKRNIQSYNSSTKERLPYIVFIIDELADFMMTSGKEMEAAIIRLAQMSRAIGIHLILATQRPSVDVITGLIKANIPTRIAFSVASSVDSKTILDSSGAEKLLGQGDMLFSSAETSKPRRIQGAFLSDDEINDVINYIKEKSGPADYLEGVTDRQKVSGNAGIGLDGNHGDEDELLQEAQELIIKARKASTSMLQRRLSIGYGRAAKILDRLEEQGIIGPSHGSKPREVFISPEQYQDLGGVVSSMPVHKRSESSAPDNYLEEENSEEEEEVLVFKEEDGNRNDNNDNKDDNNENQNNDEIKKRKLDKESEDEKDEENDDEVLGTDNEDDNNENDSKDIDNDSEDSEEDGQEEDQEEEIEKEEKENKTKKEIHTPLDDDDEMFFAK